jgi:hypothetical protein
MKKEVRSSCVECWDSEVSNLNRFHQYQESGEACGKRREGNAEEHPEVTKEVKRKTKTKHVSNK